MTTATRPEFAALEKGQEVASRTVQLSRADLVRYAAVSGDFNPIHWNQDFATSVGLPNVIAHGMLTMGAAMQVVVDWAGDPAAVVDVQTRFTKPVVVPNVFDTQVRASTALTVVAKVGALDDQARTARIDLTVTAPDLADPGVAAQEAAPLKVLVKAQAVVACA
ncbi:MaoC/PaaZ C-terminal domain-containing protein [Kocuria sp.]|uniref:MaoC/PaaZ C-terminal domain-containing protein n=1 Tax=Kocuria sp. TaxID=1871328 RepID=UPI0026DFAFDA|nr:MaoC/PaaZ C-terminal domain-containing protein [Kocuria sp.]MDO5617435.1 MaoC/PaaZ C-terminal domain-containing protein [Kocuria sp.]